MLCVVVLCLWCVLCFLRVVVSKSTDRLTRSLQFPRPCTSPSHAWKGSVPSVWDPSSHPHSWPLLRWRGWAGPQRTSCAWPRNLPSCLLPEGNAQLLSSHRAEEKRTVQESPMNPSSTGPTAWWKDKPTRGFHWLPSSSADSSSLS